MNESFDLLEIKSSSTPLELNKTFTSDLNQSQNDSFADKASEDDTICFTIDSNDSSSHVPTQNSIETINTDRTNNSGDSKLKRKYPIETKHSPFQFTTLKYDVTNLMYKEPKISVNFLVKKIRNILLENEINQKLFGKALLNCAESTISLLLSRPKDWNMLSRRGKEPYYKMYFWFKDPNGLNKLNTWIQNFKRISKFSNKKPKKIDDVEDLNESIEFISPCESPISNIIKPDDNLISLNEIQLQTLPLHKQHQAPQPINCASTSSASTLFRPPIHQPEQTRIHQLALNQSVQYLPVHQVHQLPLNAPHHSFHTSQLNPTNFTQSLLSTPSYIISRPSTYHILTNNDRVYEISQVESIRLESYHKINPYPTNEELMQLSQVFNININTLVHWFKSRSPVMANVPASYNSFCNCQTCLSLASFPSYLK